MAKIMLVEDDNNLRQIYEDRLGAEGYTIVSAKDGEEALALAVKEKPDLIIADIMMPKVSGFDMLDILRSTPETKDAKIVMMTALSQAEDQGRAEKLGADKYLVKSQVTLEDVVDVANDMLRDIDAGADLSAIGAVTSEPVPAKPAQTSQQPTEAPAPQTTATSATPEPASSMPTANIPVAAPPDSTPASSPAATADNTAVVPQSDQTVTATDDAATPTDSTTTGTDTTGVTNNPDTSSTPDEATIKNQIDEFIASNPTLSTSAEPSTPTAQPSAQPSTTPEPVSEVSDKTEPTTTASPAPAASTESAPSGTAPATPQAAPKTITVTDGTESTAPLIQPAPATNTSSIDAASKEQSASNNPVVVSQPSQPAPEPVAETPATDTKAAQSAEAMAAVDGLLNETKTEEPENKPTDNEESKDKGYIAPKTSDEPEAQSMSHTKRIEPTPGITAETPNINELLAQEANHDAPAPPPVNSVITPGGGSISPLPGSTVEEAIEGGATKPEEPSAPANDPGSITL